MNKTKIAAMRRLDVHLHGWDAQEESWHGPIPLTLHHPASRRIGAKMQTARGAFHAKVPCIVPGVPSIEFFISAYDLGDSGLAIVHMDGGPANPVGIVAAVPQSRRKLLRNEYAFELMTLLSFLGTPVNQGCELAIHEYIETTLRAEVSGTLVFAVETAQVDADASIVLSAHFEQIAAAMLEWLASKEVDEALLEVIESRAGAFIPGDCQPTVLAARYAAG